MRLHDEDDYVELWWDEEDDEWSERAYYEQLADHFQRQYDDLIIMDGELIIDCE